MDKYVTVADCACLRNTHFATLHFRLGKDSSTRLKGDVDGAMASRDLAVPVSDFEIRKRDSIMDPQCLIYCARLRGRKGGKEGIKGGKLST